MRTFSYIQYPKFVSYIVNEILTQVGATECKNRVIVCKHNYNFLRSARKLERYANFVVVVSLLNERFHGFHNDCDGSVWPSFWTVGCRRFWKFFVENLNFPSVTFWYIDGWHIHKIATSHCPSKFTCSGKKFVEETECSVWKQFSRTLETNSIENESFVQWL